MLRIGALAIVVAFVPFGGTRASELPAEIDKCVETRISDITADFPGAPGGGHVVHYENGGQQLSFDKVAGMEHSRIGDPVRVCLVAVAKGCPPGDARGRTYEGTNLRTGLTWRAPDTLVHDCTGA